MAIFTSNDRIVFGDPFGTLVPQRPTPYGGIQFVQAQVEPGQAYLLDMDDGGDGYHIFRSRTVGEIRERYLHDFWAGKYKDSVKHFAVNTRASRIIDEYVLHNAEYQFYWVLSQDSEGHLRQVKFKVSAATPADYGDRRSFLLTERAAGAQEAPSAWQPLTPTTAAPAPRAAAPVAAAPVAAPAPPTPAPVARTDAELRIVDFIGYESPSLFKILPVAPNVVQYNIYIGPQVPEAAHADPLWDQRLLAKAGLRGFVLPGTIDVFEDLSSPAGEHTYLAIFSVHADGSVTQPQLAVPASRPPRIAQLS